MIIAVTGANGFVASHLLPKLLARGGRVVALLRPGNDPHRVEALGCEVRWIDLADPATHKGAFTGIEAVIHLAGMALSPTFLPAVIAGGVRRAIFIGSTGVHTRLVSSGADAKRRGEAALRAAPLEWTILRPTMIYGTTADRNVVRLLRALKRFPVFPAPGGGTTPQQPVHVEDLANAIVTCLDRPASIGAAFDLGGAEALSLAEMVRVSAAAMGRRAWIVPVPLSPAHAGVVALRALRLPTPVSPEQVLRLAESKAVDIAPARAAFGYAPRTFAAGVGPEAAAVLAGG